MESSTKSVEPSDQAGAGGDKIISKEEPMTAAQSIEDDGLGPEFSPNWRFYLAFASLAVVTLAVCRFSFFFFGL